ncbi:helix-turn-helix transcriptional regulator [Virgibacillus doumboii]|uniref:helix-turn-helix transcriptional regulator n=1 Tax=Virgibacillus doumboii TaxID=2697503 RepID=UPI0013E06013|nr:helix-turn-helix transcriptional regulator [Virgibacillus doumboii]
MKNKVALFRKEHGYSQEFLAKKLGVSRQTIISIEKEKYNPSLPLALLIAEVFETEVKHIFSLEESDRP